MRDPMRPTGERQTRSWWQRLVLAALAVLASCAACSTRGPIAAGDVACIRPTIRQEYSIARLIDDSTVHDAQGATLDLDPLILTADGMPAGWTYPARPEYYGAAEVISGWWGRCWPGDFE